MYRQIWPQFPDTAIKTLTCLAIKTMPAGWETTRLPLCHSSENMDTHFIKLLLLKILIQQVSMGNRNLLYLKDCQFLHHTFKQFCVNNSLYKKLLIKRFCHLSDIKSYVHFSFFCTFVYKQYGSQISRNSKIRNKIKI